MTVSDNEIRELELEIEAARPFVEIAGSVYRNGVCLVRSLYDADMIRRVAASVAEIYDERDRQAALGELPAHIAPHHLEHRAIALDDVVVDGRPAAECLVSPLVKSIAAFCLMSRDLNIHNGSYFRCARPGEKDLELPFHQDSRILYTELLNLWVPLTACGRDAPGLEVLAQRLYVLEPTISSCSSHYARVGVEIDSDRITRNHGVDRIWHPAFEPGDAFIFYGTTIHRTYVTPEMRGERTSVDLRLIVPPA